jgi:haloalkane dehalogenase
MVPDSENHPSTAVMDRLGAWVGSFPGPSALVWGRRDPILGRGLRRHREALPEASVRECDAGHFSQEEVPELWAEAIREVAL